MYIKPIINFFNTNDKKNYFNNLLFLLGALFGL